MEYTQLSQVPNHQVQPSQNVPDGAIDLMEYMRQINLERVQQEMQNPVAKPAAAKAKPGQAFKIKELSQNNKEKTKQAQDKASTESPSPNVKANQPKNSASASSFKTQFI